MRIILYLPLVIVICILTILSCEEGKEKIQEPKITGKLVNHSECLSGLKGTNVTMAMPGNLSCVEYNFDENSSRLTIKHLNAGFNCCPDSISCDISFENGLITIEESESSSLCNCNCLYDLDIEIDGVISGKYKIKFIEPYSGGQDSIKFEIDLTRDKTGSICMNREMYPWGV